MTTIHTVCVGRRSRMARHVLAAVAFVVLLGGCYQSSPVAQTAYPVDYRKRHPITLREGEHTVEIFLGRNRGGLTPSQRADVLAFAQNWHHDATSGIIIDVPRGGVVGRAAAETLREIYSIFAASGVPQRALYLRRSAPSATALASIKIRYSQLTAHAGPCGLWPNDLGPAPDVTYNENRPYWNFGCATQHNLAAMVDDPADLVQPRGATPAFAARRSIAIHKWAVGENPSGTYTGYDKGKISDLGK